MVWNGLDLKNRVTFSTSFSSCSRIVHRPSPRDHKERASHGVHVIFKILSVSYSLTSPVAEASVQRRTLQRYGAQEGKGKSRAL